MFVTICWACVKAPIKVSSANSCIFREHERTTRNDDSVPRNDANAETFDAVLFFKKLLLVPY